MRYLRRSSLLLPLLLAWWPWVASAELAPPEGEVLLVISGEIAHSNVGEEAHFDREMLQAIGWHAVETHTPWHQEAGRFEGPLLRDLLGAVGARAERIQVQALNAFEAEIPLSDLLDYDVILAVKLDGEPIRIREFGPLFVLYPFDAHPELLNEAVRFRSVWHVARIHVP